VEPGTAGEQSVDGLLLATYREHAGRIIGSLVRSFGDLELAEEALHDACAAALRSWNPSHPPSNPAAWLHSVARNRSIDMVRKRQRGREQLPLVALDTPSHPDPDEQAIETIQDERLRMMFACCHPALSMEARVPLMLKYVSGLSTPEIAAGLMAPEATIAQRIVRAKKKIKASGIGFDVPDSRDVHARLEDVQVVIYLIFNQGYFSDSSEKLVRSDLCADAIRLAEALVQLLAREKLIPELPESLGLLALLLLTHARLPARLSSEAFVPLEHQDRSAWNREEIKKGTELLDQAVAMRWAGPYQIQAAIAALHGEAASYEETDWEQISLLYGKLAELAPSAAVAVNHALAQSMVNGPSRALSQLDAETSPEALSDYLPYHVSRADLLRRLGRDEEAKGHLDSAIELATNPSIIDFLKRERASIG
jgi:RNA polymerase sigma-70 factor, ECF subfamily